MNNWLFISIRSLGDSLEERMVPAARLELARPCERQILSLLCLPIPPRGQKFLRGYVLYNQLKNYPRPEIRHILQKVQENLAH